MHLYMSFFDNTGKDPGHRAGRKLLEKGLRELYGMSFKEETLGKGENGKPFLTGRPDIHFNISHTEGLAVCVFSDSSVGADVERVRPVRDPLVRRVLHEEEQRVLNRFRDGVVLENGKEVSVFAAPEREQAYDTVFFRYWTLKESYLKQNGCGLTREPREIRFDLEPEDWESPVSCSDTLVICRQERIQRDSDEYILSICTGRNEGSLTHGRSI